MRPVATRAIWYPEATLGFMELVGVNVLEQLDGGDVPYAGATRELQIARAANAYQDILEDLRRQNGIEYESGKSKRMNR